MMYINALGAELKVSAKSVSTPTTTSGRDVLTGTAANETYYMAGGDLVSGAGGDDSYYIFDTTSVAVENAGQGIDTLYARQWGTAQLAANIENLILGGKGTTGGIGNALDNVIIAGTIGARLNGMRGNDVLVGGSGYDTFEIAKGNGSDVIMNFEHAKDMISLSGYGLTSMSQVRAAATQVGADLQISLGNSESLILRGTSLSGLSAVDFKFGIDKVGTMAANVFDVIPFSPAALTQQMWGGSAVFTSNGWYVLNGAWNVGGLVAYKDFMVNSTFTKADLNEGVTFNWTFVQNTGPFPVIRAFPDLTFGASPKGNLVDSTHTFPLKVSDIVEMKANYDVSYRGDAAGFNVSFDFYLTSVPNGNKDTITNEVMIWLHEGDFPPFGERVGTYEDGDFAATIWKDTKSGYTVIAANDDVNKGTIDLAKILAKLVDLGIASSDSYFASIQLGSEVVEGEGSLTINKLELDVQSMNANGSITQKVVSGGGLISQKTFMPGVPTVHTPVANSDSLASFAEDSGAYSIRASDLLANDTSGGGAALSLKSISNVTGGTAVLSADRTTVLFTPAANFNGKASFTYTTSNGEATASAVASFNVTPVNDAPTAIALGSRSIAEHSDTGTVVGTLVGSDPDAGDTLTYRLIDNAGGRFAIAPGTGDLVVANGASIDYETATSHSVMVRVTDAAGAYHDEQFTISVINIAELTRNGTSAADVIDITTPDNWTVNGFAGADTIRTAGGADIIDGGAGNDIMSGGAGNDLFLIGLNGGYDVINGGSGQDEVRATEAGAVIGWGGYSSVEKISSGGFAGVQLKGTIFDDRIDLSNATVSGIELINGGGGADTIIGSAANDRITGAEGADTLTGGAGSDTFVFATARSSRADTGIDTITDFTRGSDHIDLSRMDANSLVTGDQGFTFIGTAAFNGDRGVVRYDTSTAGETHVLVDTNGDMVADFDLVLTGTMALSAGDFIL
jgi:Ca2+-binding RTX toxin-like protein